MPLGERFDPVIIAAREGEAWAMTEIYRDIHPRLLRFLRSKWPSEAEDLASEVWLDVAGALRRFAGDEADLQRWVFTIAWRRLLDARRQAMRRRTAPAPAESLAWVSGGDVEAEGLASLGSAESLRLVASLPDEQATIVLLRVLGGFDADEVAAILGRRPGTVRVMQHRALKKLQRMLEMGEVTSTDAGRYDERDATTET